MNSGKIFSRLTAMMLCGAMLLSAGTLTALAEDDEPEYSEINIDDPWGDSDDGWYSDDDGNYFISGNVIVVNEEEDCPTEEGSPKTFNLTEGSTVIWSADFTGQTENLGDALITVTGTGTFIVDNGAIILDTSGITLLAEDSIAIIVGEGGRVIAFSGGAAVSGGSSVTVDGGSVWAEGDCVAVDSADVTVTNDGAVSAFGYDNRCIGINASGSVTITDGGDVWAESEVGCSTIYADGDVSIIDGQVASNPVKLGAVAVRSDNEIEISVLGDSKVWASGGAILAKNASVTVGGNSLMEIRGMLRYMDGELLGNAIMAKNVTIEDNARITARNGAAIFLSGELNIRGGAVFAYGDGIGGASFEFLDTIGSSFDYMYYDIGDEAPIEDEHAAEPMLNAIFHVPDLDLMLGAEYIGGKECLSGIVDDGMTIVWDFNNWESGEHSYTTGDTADIYVFPENSDCSWSAVGRNVVIVYTKGETNGRIAIDFSIVPRKPLKPNPKRDPSAEQENNSNIVSVTPFGSFTGGSDYTRGAGAGVVYTVQKSFSLFSAVSVGGATLTRDRDYRAENGSTKITLLPSYLNTLVVGSYTLTVAFTDNTSIAARFTIAENPNPFTDVAEDSRYYDAVKYVCAAGLMVGTSDNTFEPDTDLSRAMIVTILYRNAGEPDSSDLKNPFNDVQDGAWYTDAVKWAADKGIVQGYGNGIFGINDAVTREQFAALIYRTQQASGKIPPDTSESKTFGDAYKISSWAKAAVTALNRQGLFNDIPDSDFAPQSSASRSEVALVLYRYLTAI